ncbi:hypothetical protein CDAR_434841 [Caerostris darwini]|uniref:Uncharacterized protein n=1 Tax=Caerostris darwini TaxID=1538125 RepID=A0AAV4QCE2_9ARAC|nr:hypothetical protein CDAR_434841 [Caerostris darwini]
MMTLTLYSKTYNSEYSGGNHKNLLYQFYVNPSLARQKFCKLKEEARFALLGTNDDNAETSSFRRKSSALGNHIKLIPPLLVASRVLILTFQNKA